MEEWKRHPTLRDIEVSTRGRVRYIETKYLHGLAKRMRTLKLTGFGYFQVSVGGKTYSVHKSTGGRLHFLWQRHL